MSAKVTNRKSISFGQIGEAIATADDPEMNHGLTVRFSDGHMWLARWEVELLP
jgi:hypothetical protein